MKAFVGFILFFLLAPSAHHPHASTFLKFPVVKQIDQANYVVHGVIGRKWVAFEDRTKQPYTYWDLKITQQLSGNELADTVAVRQPGGTIGNNTYAVSGSASFKQDEEVVLMLKDTHESAKEIMGLMSGKYSIVYDGGEKHLQNALGSILKNESGHAINMGEFHALVKRATNQEYTSEDLAIVAGPKTKDLHGHNKQNKAPKKKDNITKKVHSKTNNIKLNTPQAIPKNKETLSEDKENPDNNASFSNAILIAIFSLGALGALLWLIWFRN